MVAMSFNSDIGDSWEWADSPRVSGEVFGAGDSTRRQLRALRAESLALVNESRHSRMR